MNEPLVITEPLVTGELRVELRGDQHVAAQHVHYARKVMADVHNIHDTKSGGFYSIRRVLPDGTIILASTNNGNDAIEIYPPPQEREEPVSEPERVPEPVPEPEPLFSYDPYLWIGVRVKEGGEDKDGDKAVELHLCVWVLNEKDGQDRTVILSNWGNFGYSGSPLQDLPDKTDEGLYYTEGGVVQISPDKGFDMLAPMGDDEWDEIVIDDPIDELETGHKGCWGGASYIVKVMAKGDDCTNITPAVIELLVVTGRGESMRGQSTEFTIEEFTEYQRGVLPYGCFGYTEPASNDPCETCHSAANDDGANPHAKHWWQGAARVFVAPYQKDVPAAQFIESSCGFTDEEDVPPNGFDVGAEWPSRLDRCPDCQSVEQVEYTYITTTGYRYRVVVVLGPFDNWPNGAPPPEEVGNNPLMIRWLISTVYMGDVSEIYTPWFTVELGLGYPPGCGSFDDIAMMYVGEHIGEHPVPYYTSHRVPIITTVCRKVEKTY